MGLDEIKAFAKSQGYDDVEYLCECRGFSCYRPCFHDEGDTSEPTGLPCVILVDKNGNIRWSEPFFQINQPEPAQADTFTSRFGGRLCYAMPDGRYVYHYRGQDYLLDEGIADPEAVMKDSLEQGENLLISIFTVVDLYPDPDCDY